MFDNSLLPDLLFIYNLTLARIVMVRSRARSARARPSHHAHAHSIPLVCSPPSRARAQPDFTSRFAGRVSTIGRDGTLSSNNAAVAPRRSSHHHAAQPHQGKQISPTKQRRAAHGGVSFDSEAGAPSGGSRRREHAELSGAIESRRAAFQRAQQQEQRHDAPRRPVVAAAPRRGAGSASKRSKKPTFADLQRIVEEAEPLEPAHRAESAGSAAGSPPLALQAAPRVPQHSDTKQWGWSELPASSPQRSAAAAMPSSAADEPAAAFAPAGALVNAMFSSRAERDPLEAAHYVASPQRYAESDRSTSPSAHWGDEGAASGGAGASQWNSPPRRRAVRPALRIVADCDEPATAAVPTDISPRRAAPRPKGVDISPRRVGRGGMRPGRAPLSPTRDDDGRESRAERWQQQEETPTDEEEQLRRRVRQQRQQAEQRAAAAEAELELRARAHEPRQRRQVVQQQPYQHAPLQPSGAGYERVPVPQHQQHRQPQHRQPQHPPSSGGYAARALAKRGGSRTRRSAAPEPQLEQPPAARRRARARAHEAPEPTAFREMSYLKRGGASAREAELKGRNESLVRSEQDQLYYSRKARPVDYAPKTKALRKQEYRTLGKLKADLNDPVLVAKRANQMRVKEFSKKLGKVNRTVLKQQENAAAARPRRARAPAAKSKREKAIEFAKRSVPKPKMKEKSGRSPAPRVGFGRRAPASKPRRGDEKEQRERQEFDMLLAAHEQDRAQIAAIRREVMGSQ